MNALKRTSTTVGQKNVQIRKVLILVEKFSDFNSSDSWISKSFLILSRHCPIGLQKITKIVTWDGSLETFQYKASYFTAGFVAGTYIFAVSGDNMWQYSIMNSNNKIDLGKYSGSEVK